MLRHEDLHLPKAPCEPQTHPISFQIFHVSLTLILTSFLRAMSSRSLLSTASDERRAEIEANLKRVREAIQAHSPPAPEPLLIAASNTRPISDILVCHELKQLNFGEDNAQELF